MLKNAKNSIPSQPTHSPTLHRKTFTRSTSPAAGKMSRNPSNTSHTTSGAQGPPTHQGPPYPRAIDFENTQNSTSNPSGQYVGNLASGGNNASNATSSQSDAIARYQEQPASAEPYHGFQNVSSDPRGDAGVSGSAAGVNQSGGQGGYQNGNEDTRSRDAAWGSQSSHGNQR